MAHLYYLNIDKSLVRLWLGLTVLAAGSLADVADFAVRHDGGALAVAGLACVAMLKSTVLTALYSLCRRNILLKAVAVAVIIAFALLSLLNGGCWLFYGFGISMKLFKIIAETNPTEVGEFMPELLDKLLSVLRSLWFWVSLAVIIAAWKWLPKVNGKVLAISGVALSAIGLAYLVFVFATAELGRNAYSVFVRSGRCVAKYMADRHMIRELQARKRPLSFPETLSSRYLAERIVVVIGESASRGHLSIYGYPLQTTPCLDSLRSEIYVFEDAVASSTSTADNMPRLLSFMTDEPNGKEWFEYPSLLEIFKRLGYRIYWLSNQENSGRWSNLSSILTADADVLKYVGRADSEDHLLYRYDDVLLPEWEKARDANDTLQMTFLHLMGSHFQYDRRYPSERRHFTGKDITSRMPRPWLDREKGEIIANYDNSILYTDSILFEVMEDVGNMDAPALLIYFSDHGENVYDDRDYRGRDLKYVDVPFILFANDAYKARNPDIMKNVEDALRRPFSTSELPQIIMRLSGTRYQLYDSVRDPLSPRFKVRKRWVDGEAYYREMK